MRRFKVGDRVRIDIPDKTDQDHDRYHDRVGEVIEIIEDDAGCYTGDVRDTYLFKVELSNGDVEHFRWGDLRPNIDE